MYEYVSRGAVVVVCTSVRIYNIFLYLFAYMNTYYSLYILCVCISNMQF